LLAPLAGRIYDHAPQRNAPPLGAETGDPMFDPYWLVFWPGAIAIGGFVALPVAMGLQALNRRIGRARNRTWHCGRCNAPLAQDDLEGDVFVAHGVHICRTCADVYRARYRFALIGVPTVAAVAGVVTALAVFAGPQPASWYGNFRLLPVLLPSLGVAAAFVWRLRAAKAANIQLSSPHTRDRAIAENDKPGVLAPGA
jgi:hypothetical protein